MVHWQSASELEYQIIEGAVGEKRRADVCSVQEAVDFDRKVRDQQKAFAEQSN